MIAHEIGIFGQINGFEGKSAEPLPSVDGLILSGSGASASRLRTPLPVHFCVNLRGMEEMREINGIIKVKLLFKNGPEFMGLTKKPKYPLTQQQKLDR